MTPLFRAAMIGASLISSLATSLPALAQPASGTQNAQYFFDSGMAKAKSGNCEGAIPDFEASNKAEPSRGALYRLALCEEETKKLTRAWTHFQELLPQLDQADPRLLDTQQRIAALAQQIARIRIDLAAGTPVGAMVTLDGSELPRERLGAEIPLDPGKHVLVVKAAGREDRNHDVNAKAGLQLTLTLEAGAPGRLPRPTPSRPLFAPGLVAGGVGLAGLGVMAVTGILAIGKKGELEQACPEPTSCTELAMTREGKALTTASTVAAVIGLVGTTAGITLLVWSGRGSKTATLGPVVSANGGGVVLGGHF
jgi:hypothetical protein